MKAYLAALLATLALAAALNFLADPGSRWRHDMYDLPPLWRADQCFAVPEVDFLRLKSAVLAQETASDVMVLGSSRALQIDSAMFPTGTRLFNASKDSASVTDYEALWNLAKAENKIPRQIWLFLDNTQFIQPSAASNAEKIRSAARRIFSAEILLNSLRHLAENPLETLRLRAAVGLVAQNRIPPGKGCVKNDGAFIYPDGQGLKPDPVKLRNQLTSDFNAWSLRDYLLKRDPAAIAPYVRLIEDMRDHHVRVVLIESPLHPQMFAKMTALPDTRAALSDIQSYAAAIAQQAHVKLCATFDPAVLPCDADEFEEGIHPLKSCLRKLVAYCSRARSLR